MSVLSCSSYRTKRRRIAAAVSNLIAEAQAEDSTGNADVQAVANYSSILSQNHYDTVHPDNSEKNLLDYVTEEKQKERQVFGVGYTLTDQHVEWDAEQRFDLDDSDYSLHKDAVMAPISAPGKGDCDFQQIFLDENSEWTARQMCDSDDDCDAESAPLRDKLADWAVTYNISLVSLSALLSILQPSLPDLPKDARTLLRTNRLVEIKTVAGGNIIILVYDTG